MKRLLVGSKTMENMLENLKKFRLVLASNSPRRKELLAGLDVDYEVRVLPGIDESYPDGLSGEEIPKYISRKKAEAYEAIMQPDELIITADTIVWTDGKVLGKPKDEAEAKDMLRRLSGRTHQVITGVTLVTAGKKKNYETDSDETYYAWSRVEKEYNEAHSRK